MYDFIRLIQPACWSLAIDKKVLGEDHADVATDLGNLAVLMREKGDYAAAEPLFRQALAIQKQVLGEDHPSTIGTKDRLASLLRAKGNDATT